MSINKIKDLFFLACILFLGWMVFDLKANQPRLGFIDVKKVFDGFELKKELQRKYHAEMGDRKRTLDSLGFEVQRLGIELEGKNDNAKLEVYLMKRRNYMEMLKLYEEKDARANAEYDSQIFVQLNQYIQEYGDQNGFDLVFGSAGNGSIMHGNIQWDVTNDVIKFINKRYSGN